MFPERQTTMKIFLEKFEGNYYPYFYNHIAEAKYRVITAHDAKTYHVYLFEDDRIETIAYCEELDNYFYFYKRIDYTDSNTILNALERALRSML